MAFADLIFGEDSKVRVGLLELDCCIEERYSIECEMTEHAVEAGSDITDHIIVKGDYVELTGKITNSPIVYLASIYAQSPVKETGIEVFSSSDRTTDALEYIEEQIKAKTPVDLNIGLKSFTDMIIVSANFSLNASIGDGIDITLTFKELKKSSVQFIDILPVAEQTKKVADKGQKPKKPANKAKAQQNQSTLSSGVDFIKSPFSG